MGSTSWISELKNSTRKDNTKHYVETDTENVNPDDDVQTDTELIIQYTRTPKKPPEYIPRSRRLDDLPGGIRVPIIRRDDSRVKPRLDAGREGLEELRALREAQQNLIADAKITYQREHEQARLTRFPKSFSSSVLSCIAEENHSPKQFYDIDSPVFSDTDSATQSEQGKDFVGRDFLFSRAMSSGVSGRRASIQIDSDYFRQCNAATKGNCPEPPPTLPSRLRSRRPSFQVDSIITDRQHTISTAQLISEMKLQYSSPGPMRAIMRQYGSSSSLNIKNSSSENESSNFTKRDTINSPLPNKTESYRDVSPVSPRKTNSSPEKIKSVTKADKHHSRGGSSTSDYYGSSEHISDRLVPDKVVFSPPDRTRSLSEFGSSSDTLGRFSVSDMSDEGFSYNDFTDPKHTNSEKGDVTVFEPCKDENLMSKKCEDLKQSTKIAQFKSTKGLLETSL